MNPTAAQIKRAIDGSPQTIVVLHPPAPEDIAYLVIGQEMLQLLGNECKLSLFTKIGNINATLETLTLDCNPSTPSFGNPGRTSSSGVAFKFADDSKTVRKAILEPLAMFINERFTAIKTALAGPAGMVQATKEYEKLTSQAFKVMFKKYRADQESAHLGMCWKTIECPVAPSMTNCETHAKDWKAHKPFCPK
ncbi:hypothetical protein MBLNU13_g10804t1 [Cladosporium sp. NU13]